VLFFSGHYHHAWDPGPAEVAKSSAVREAVGEGCAVSKQPAVVQELGQAADELSPAVADAVRDGACTYLEWVRQDDWPGIVLVM
jgi:hypothetical protein